MPDERCALRWEMIAAILGGIIVAWGLVAWPRLVLVGIGLLTLVLGLLSLGTLKVVTAPAASAVFVGVGLIGLGTLVAHIQALLAETRLRDGSVGLTPAPSFSLLGDDGATRQSRLRGRVEPRFFAEVETASPASSYELVLPEAVDPFGGEDPCRHIAGAAVQGNGAVADDLYGGLIRTGEQAERSSSALLMR